MFFHRALPHLLPPPNLLVSLLLNFHILDAYMWFTSKHFIERNNMYKTKKNIHTYTVCIKQQFNMGETCTRYRYNNLTQYGQTLQQYVLNLERCPFLGCIHARWIPTGDSRMKPRVGNGLAQGSASGSLLPLSWLSGAPPGAWGWLLWAFKAEFIINLSGLRIPYHDYFLDWPSTVVTLNLSSPGSLYLMSADQTTSSVPLRTLKTLVHFLLCPAAV